MHTITLRKGSRLDRMALLLERALFSRNQQCQADQQPCYMKVHISICQSRCKLVNGANKKTSYKADVLRAVPAWAASSAVPFGIAICVLPGKGLPAHQHIGHGPPPPFEVHSMRRSQSISNVKRHVLLSAVTALEAGSHAMPVQQCQIMESGRDVHGSQLATGRLHVPVTTVHKDNTSETLLYPPLTATHGLRKLVLDQHLQLNNLSVLTYHCMEAVTG